MPHKKNPAEDHNPFEVIKNARTTTTTTQPASQGGSTKKRLKKIPQQARKSKRDPGRTAEQSKARARRSRVGGARKRKSTRKSTRKPKR